MKLQLLTEDKDVNGVLKTKLNKVKNPRKKLPILKEMVKIMEENNGIGLTANQVGLTDAMFVQYININTDKQKIEYVINPKNPKIIDDRKWTLEEGCLSYPHKLVEIERPWGIEVTHHNGKEIVTKRLFGMDARVYYHELMHVRGKCNVGS